MKLTFLHGSQCSVGTNTTWGLRAHAGHAASGLSNDHCAEQLSQRDKQIEEPVDAHHLPHTTSLPRSCHWPPPDPIVGARLQAGL